MNGQNLVYLMEELAKICVDATSVCQYRELNIIGLRKILKRYDRYFPYSPEYALVM